MLIDWLCHLFYRLLRQNAARFLMEDIYRNPGPLQFDGPGSDAKAVTLSVEDQDYMGRIKHLQEYLNEVLSAICQLIFFNPYWNKVLSDICQLTFFAPPKKGGGSHVLTLLVVSPGVVCRVCWGPT